MDLQAKAKMSDVESIVGVNEARAWIEAVTGLNFAYPSFQHSLRSGVLLCLYVAGLCFFFDDSGFPLRLVCVMLQLNIVI